MIKVKLNNADTVTALLNKLADKTDNRKALMGVLAIRMEKAVLQNFEEEGRPKWLGIKPRRPRKDRDGNAIERDGKILNDTGVLKNSITAAFDNDSATVGTNLQYATIHQFGGMAGRNKKVKIPARPFLTLTSEDEKDIIDDIQTYFRNLIK
ncbi:phage virion morphogenesis protein [Pasteurella atlantica]|uniref:Phage virion morphogenesis protein n=1 Tax=Pasteurella atlantica TaxID=2827233 RepID=A0AAW8CP71_9PAST|nr:phage virion morphogenesis protein [Pasteurella atlantica]MBR0574079.1 phage virion morphogenesis protein [Pasteurella atlantica]MDP8040097.1 phage virion morphogenesis protein [Pasteurella atlantica]MDP8042210.1 phage virion morphogenesis protein [Pasteurella atlantica]MDP8044383.1 phage virion morphogenesis protein [Pasteurella atlantica]MDP8046369.1 phage virion morphogenesis protein [Pasteurella atlantica]